MKTCIAPRPGLSGAKRHGCTCNDCSAASRQHAAQRNRLIAYGRWQPYVNAEPAREHVRSLMAAGLGWMRIAKLSGASPSTVSKLLYGKSGKPPSKRIRPETEQRILAITATPELLADPALIDGTGTRRRMRAMAAVGWSLAYQARRLGRDTSNYTRILNKEDVPVEVVTMRAIADLYTELCAKPVPQGHYADRIRRRAADEGWPGPDAWDNATIDDPASQPNTVLPDPDEVVDDVAIERVYRGKASWRSLYWPDQVELYRRLREQGMADSTIRSRYKIGQSLVGKLRAAALPLTVEPANLAAVAA